MSKTDMPSSTTQTSKKSAKNSDAINEEGLKSQKSIAEDHFEFGLFLKNLCEQRRDKVKK